MLLSKRKIREEILNKKKRIREELYNAQAGKCYWCGKGLWLLRPGMKPKPTKEMKRDRATNDHVLPLSCGGPNEIDNIVVSCRKCNERRSNMMIHPVTGKPFDTNELMHPLKKQDKS